MGFLDGVTLLDYWSGPRFGIGRRGRRLLQEGERATAVIAGIQVMRSGVDGEGSNTRNYGYALDVQQSAGPPVRLGCRQFLWPHRDLAPVGSEVVVRYRKRRVIVDWEGTLAQREAAYAGRAECADLWKPLRTPPAAGVADVEQNRHRRRLARGRRARATVLRVVQLGSNIQNADVDVLITDAQDGSTREALIARIVPPDYGAHLLTVGAVLPVGVDQDGARITVDWVAAANGEVAFDPHPPAPTRDPDAAAAAPDPVGGGLAGLLQSALTGAVASSGVAVDVPEAEGIDFDTWVEVSAGIAHEQIPADGHDAYAVRHGVRPGAWAGASQAWQARAGADWNLAARYSDAYQQAFQRRS